MKKLILGLVTTLACTNPLAADEFEAAMQQFLNEHTAGWASDPVRAAVMGSGEQPV